MVEGLEGRVTTLTIKDATVDENRKELKAKPHQDTSRDGQHARISQVAKHRQCAFAEVTQVYVLAWVKGFGAMPVQCQIVDGPPIQACTF